MKRTKLEVCLTDSFKRNTQSLIDDLFNRGLIDSKDMSPYFREAVKEKRDRDRERIVTLDKVG